MKDSTSALLDFLDTISLEEQEIFVKGLPQQTPYQMEVYKEVLKCHPWEEESLAVGFDRLMEHPTCTEADDYDDLMECLIEAYMDHIKFLRDEEKHTIAKVESYIETLSDSYHKYYQTLHSIFFEDLDWDGGYRNFMETDGDLDDLKRMAEDFKKCNKQHNFFNLANIWNFINASQMVCQPQDIENIATIAEFRLSYPHLYATMTVWAWG